LVLISESRQDFYCFLSINRKWKPLKFILRQINIANGFFVHYTHFVQTIPSTTQPYVRNSTFQLNTQHFQNKNTEIQLISFFLLQCNDKASNEWINETTKKTTQPTENFPHAALIWKIFQFSFSIQSVNLQPSFEYHTYPLSRSVWGPGIVQQLCVYMCANAFTTIVEICDRPSAKCSL
jgi:hypothetical protein